MERLRHDLNYLVSAGLLVAALGAILTGIVAQLWDLNDFWYHTYAGYAMSVLSLAHVWLNWQRLIAYARFRLTRRSARKLPVTRAPRDTAPAAAITPSVRQARRTLIDRLFSRRGFFGLAIGSSAGILIGRGFKQPPPIANGTDLGVVYHQWSKPGVIDVLGTVANWGEYPPLYKAYPAAPRIPLPPPALENGLATEAAIRQRRSTRNYIATPLPLEALAQVLYLAAGITGERWGNRVRAAPSSGALYPIETYVVAHNVAGLERGVYHYNIADHGLHEIRAADMRAEVVQQGLNQQFLGQCGAVIIFTVLFQRMRPKYQDRTYRYGLIEAGHLGQNVYLAATSMGLGACGVGAFMDDAINVMLGVDGIEEAAVYLLALGNTG